MKTKAVIFDMDGVIVDRRPYLSPVPNLIDLLERLKAADIKMAVGTSADTNSVNFVLNRLKISDYFQAAIGISMVRNGKPAPDTYLKVAETIGENPENCVVIEDSVSGIRAGKSAGMKVIAITTTRNREDLQEADLIIDDYKEIDITSLQ
jgi:beta-phosphoglucomutase-like phosphatase (HAD superfamily)